MIRCGKKTKADQQLSSPSDLKLLAVALFIQTALWQRVNSLISSLATPAVCSSCTVLTSLKHSRRLLMHGEAQRYRAARRHWRTLEPPAERFIPQVACEDQMQHLPPFVTAFT